MGEKKKKKKSTVVVGTLMTSSRPLILVPLNEEEKAQQLIETLEKSMFEKRVTIVSHLEGIGPIGFELQKKALEEATRRKPEKEVARARGEGTSAQEGVTLERGAGAQ